MASNHNYETFLERDDCNKTHYLRLAALQNVLSIRMWPFLVLDCAYESPTLRSSHT